MRALGGVLPVVFSSARDRKTDRKVSRQLNHWRSPCPLATRSKRKADRDQEIKRREDPGVWESKMQMHEEERKKH